MDTLKVQTSQLMEVLQFCSCLVNVQRDKQFKHPMHWEGGGGMKT